MVDRRNHLFPTSIREALLFLALTMASTLVWAILRALPFRLAVKQSRALASGFTRWTAGLPPSRIHALVDLATRIPNGRGRCLPRSILLSGLQAGSDASMNLLIGVTRSGSSLESHAWVEPCNPSSSMKPENTDRFSVVVRL